MREFDLEAAKRGEPIVCRDGTPAKFVAHVPDAYPTQRLVVLVNKKIHVYLESGQWTGTKQNREDLFMAPKKRTVWVNFYQKGWASYYDSEHEANHHFIDHKTTKRIGNRAYPVEIEE